MVIVTSLSLPPSPDIETFLLLVILALDTYNTLGKHENIHTCSGSLFKILSLSASSTKLGMNSKAKSGAKLADAADSCESLQTSAHWSDDSVWTLYKGKCKPPEIRRLPLAEPGTTP